MNRSRVLSMIAPYPEKYRGHGTVPNEVIEEMSRQ